MGEEFFGVLPAGTVLQKYRIKQVLGRPGGFGVTYLAEDSKLLREVAVKEYLPNAFAVRQGDTTVSVRSEADRESFEWGMKYFLKESQVLARFHHRHIVQIHDFFEANCTAYIVMEYARGDTLGAVLQREGTLDQSRLSALMLNILDGLEILHRESVYHRDIKPENVIVRPNGEPVLIDFGAARNALGSKSISILNILTPGYAPVEQYGEKEQQGPWTDIYSLAAVAYRVISGNKPLDAIARMGKDSMVPATEAGRGRYSEHFLKAIDAALSFHPKDRPQSVAEFRQLMSAPADDPTIRLDPSERSSPQPPSKLHDGDTRVVPLSPSPSSNAKPANLPSPPPASMHVAVLPTMAGKVQTAESSPSGQPSSSKSRKPVVMIIGASALAAAAGGVGWVTLRGSHPAAEVPASASVPAPAPATVAVPVPAPAPPPATNNAQPTAAAEPAAPDQPKQAAVPAEPSPPPVAETSAVPEAAPAPAPEVRAPAPAPAARADKGANELEALGRKYATGAGVPQNFGKAMDYYRRAAERGNTVAMDDLGGMYESGQGAPVDYIMAKSYYRQAADKGDAEGLRNLGDMYRDGHGVRVDYPEAISYYRQAIDKGSAYAMNNLALMYAQGRGVRADPEKAISYLEQAAEKGNPWALTNLGSAYKNGVGARINYEKALNYFHRAAGAGSVPALTNLGDMYRAGQGVAPDFGRAMTYYREAASRGDPAARERLNSMEAQERPPLRHPYRRY